MKNAWMKVGFAAAAVMVLLSTGCATSGRFVVLKEFEAHTVKKENSPLKGKSVFVEKFAWEPNLPQNKPTTKIQEPEGFANAKMSDEQKKMWDDLYKAQRKEFVKSDANKIGYVRNGFGIPMSGVFVMGDPGQWVKESLEMEAVQQGATIAATADQADLAVSGKITWLMADMFMALWADLVVNMQLTPKGKAPAALPIHTGATITAWTSSSFEFYNPIRQSLQKTMMFALPEMEKAVQR